MLKLEELGWEVLVIWQCELKETDAVKVRLIGFLGLTKC